MMRIGSFTACVAALVLTACGPPAATNAPPTATTTTDTSKPSAPTAAPPSASTENAPTPAQLVGRWGDNGDCAKDIVFAADGTFRSYTGGSGRWSLGGDIMTMTGANGTFQVRVSVLNQNTLLIRNPDGSIGTSQRC